MAQRSVRDYRNTPFYNSVHLMVNVAKQSSPALPLLTCGELAVSKGLTKMSKQQRQGCVCVRARVCVLLWGNKNEPLCAILFSKQRKHDSLQT